MAKVKKLYSANGLQKGNCTFRVTAYVVASGVKEARKLLRETLTVYPGHPGAMVIKRVNLGKSQVVHCEVESISY